MRITTITVCLGVAVILLTPSVASSAEAHVSFCGKWRSQYTDSGIGEDVFTSASTYDRPAQYAYSSIYEVAPGTDPVIWGHTGLAENGCTPLVEVEVGKQYRFRMRTITRYDSSRYIFVQNDTAEDWTTGYPDGYVIYDFYFTPTRASVSYLVTVVAGKTWETNIAPIAGKIWDRQEDGAITIYSNTTILIRKSTAYSYAQYDSNNDWYRVWSGGNTTSVKKFVAGHEIGHAVGDRLADLHGSNYTSYQPTTLCSCDHIDTDTTTDGCQHCLQSREYIRAGESEGWAHYFSTVVFNNRSSQDGWFGYYKDINYAAPATDCTSPPCPIDVTDDKTWMEDQCSDGYADRGVEWDWLAFFWGLWTEDATNRYTMNQIALVWDEVHDVDTESNHNELWRWEDLVQAADNLYTGYKFEEFEEQGGNSGVDH